MRKEMGSLISLATLIFLAAPLAACVKTETASANLRVEYEYLGRHYVSDMPYACEHKDSYISSTVAPHPEAIATVLPDGSAAIFGTRGLCIPLLEPGNGVVHLDILSKNRRPVQTLLPPVMWMNDARHPTVVKSFTRAAAFAPPNVPFKVEAAEVMWSPSQLFPVFSAYMKLKRAAPYYSSKRAQDRGPEDRYWCGAAYTVQTGVSLDYPLTVKSAQSGGAVYISTQDASARFGPAPDILYMMLPEDFDPTKETNDPTRNIANQESAITRALRWREGLGWYMPSSEAAEPYVLYLQRFRADQPSLHRFYYDGRWLTISNQAIFLRDKRELLRPVTDCTGGIPFNIL